MLQEMQILIETNLRMYCRQMLFNYRKSESKETECFYIVLAEDLQHRTQLERTQVEGLIKFLQDYLTEMDKPKV